MERRFHFRASDGLLATIELAAARSHQSASEFIRQAAIRAIRESGLDVPAREQEEAR